SLTFRPLAVALRLQARQGLGSATRRAYRAQSRRPSLQNALAPCAGIRFRSVQSLHHHGRRNPGPDLAERARVWLWLAASRRFRTAPRRDRNAYRAGSLYSSRGGEWLFRLFTY